MTLYGRWTALDQQVKPGEYLLPVNSTAESLLALLISGDVIQYQVTLPEGITLAEVLDILNQEEQLEKTLKGITDPRIVELTLPYSHPEGLFFPDTYHYVRSDSDWSVLQRSHSAMNAAASGFFAAISFAIGCSAAIAQKLIPYSVSGRVV